jgi:xanthine dehydrogenase accessory factor
MDRMKSKKRINELIVMIRGAGDVASGVAHRLHRSHFKICMTEISRPLAVRRAVAFCEAVYDGKKKVEGVEARLISGPEKVRAIWKTGCIPVLIDPEGRETRKHLKPDVLVDAIMAKKNLGTRIRDASLVIGVGPGFTAGRNAHAVIETNRGHDLGRVIWKGSAEPDTGIPGEIRGYSIERVLRTMKKGIFHSHKLIGDRVKKGSVVAVVDDFPVIAEINGILRGVLREGTEVEKGMKVGDIDPRAKREYCFTISDKARAISGGVLEAILHFLKG